MEERHFTGQRINLVQPALILLYLSTVIFTCKLPVSDYDSWAMNLVRIYSYRTADRCLYKEYAEKL